MIAPALVAEARKLRRPTLFLPGLPSRDPQEFVSLDEVIAELIRLADGRTLTFRPGFAHYPDLDGFPSITAYAGGEYLATLGNRWNEPAQNGALQTLRARAA